MSEMLTKAVRAMLDDLAKGDNHGCLYDERADGAVVIRGHVDLNSLARSAIAALRDADERMIDAGDRSCWDEERREYALVACTVPWRAMIDAILNEHPEERNA